MLEIEGVDLKDFLKIDKRESELSRKNIEFLRKHYREIEEKYGGSIVAISNGKVIGTFNREDFVWERLEECTKEFEKLVANLEPIEEKTLLLTYIPRPDEVLMF